MSLSCTCYEDAEWCYEDAEWYFEQPDGFSELKTKRSRACKSCGKKICVGEVCVKFSRDREPKNDIEERIYGRGPSISLPAWYHCEQCGEIWLNLTDAGYCLQIDESMADNLVEYHEISGFKK